MRCHDADDSVRLRYGGRRHGAAAAAVAAMMKIQRGAEEAGVLITLDGLHRPSMGARVSFAGGKPIVTDGPFTEAKEVLGGYSMIDVKSRDEAMRLGEAVPCLRQ